MAGANLTYSGKLNLEEIELTCSADDLSVIIIPPSKLYFWKGEINSQILTESQSVLSSAPELYEALVEVLEGKSTSSAKITLNFEKKIMNCKFIVFKKVIEIFIPVERVGLNLEKMQELLYEEVHSTKVQMNSLERNMNEHVQFERELFEQNRKELSEKLEKVHLAGCENNEKDGQLKEQIKKMNENVLHLTDQLKSLSDIQRDMQISIDKLTDRVQKIEEKNVTLLWEPRFLDYREEIRLSSDKRTATKTGKTGDFGLFAGPNFPSEGTRRFSVKLMGIGERGGGLAIGVVLDSADIQNGAFKQPTAFMFYCGNGGLYNSGNKIHQLIDVKVHGGNRVGDVIGVEVNMKEHSLQFYVNGVAAGAQIPLPFTAVQLAHLAPAVDLHHADLDSVQIV